jgi:uncharacterized peroxidase-related enzyme
MRQFSVPTRDQVEPKAQQIFDNLEKQLTFVPNLYAVLGYSPDALEALLNFGGTIGKSSFNNKELEAIKLAVSEVNQCSYCLAAHTAISKMNGLTEADTLDLRAATSDNPRFAALAQLAKSVSENRGKASNEAVENFFAAGFDNKALIDLVGVVIEISFTNYLHNLTQIPVDFPAAKSLEAVA